MSTPTFHPATVDQPVAGGRVILRGVLANPRLRIASRFTLPQAERRLVELGDGWQLWNPLRKDKRWYVQQWPVKETR